MAQKYNKVRAAPRRIVDSEGNDLDYTVPALVEVVGDGSPLPSAGDDPGTWNGIGVVAPLDGLLLDAGSVSSAAVLPIGGDVFIDTKGYQSISVQFTSVGTGNSATFEISNDNVNWLGAVLTADNVGFFTSSGNLAFGTGNSLGSTANQIYSGRITARYFRVRASAWASGTITALACLRHGRWTPAPFSPIGTTGQGSAPSSGPMPTGPIARTSNSVVTNGQMAYQAGTLAGATVVMPYSIPELNWAYAAATGGIVSSVTAVMLVASAGASTRNYITSLQVGTDTLGTATELVIRDGAGGPVLWRQKLNTAAMPLQDIKFSPPLKGSAATLMEACLLTSSTGGVFINAQGYQAP